MLRVLLKATLLPTRGGKCFFSTSLARKALKNSEGQKVPSVIWPIRVGSKWEKLSSDELFDQKTVAVLALPGAFTQTCSSNHLPRYNELEGLFKKHGVDKIVCISVNDSFVMNEWARSQKIDKVTLVPDGNGEFTEKMGMLVNKDSLGFGKRSWRYSMLVKNRVIEKMWIEREVEGDPYEVSDAETMLKYLDPSREIPKAITIFTKRGCQFCQEAKRLLDSKNLHYEELVIGEDLTPTGLRGVSGKTTVPQIFYGGKHVGGQEELKKFLKNICF
ncbi:hybrid peroxiredoxin hyPrx5-like [Zophobas morio]|uniref:hybrid peroxiredoxin hyPrx5-like n=1 Tax=Zophobas morio TaxID=2755281 RepID=UPI00308315EE